MRFSVGGTVVIIHLLDLRISRCRFIHLLCVSSGFHVIIVDVASIVGFVIIVPVVITGDVFIISVVIVASVIAVVVAIAIIPTVVRHCGSGMQEDVFSDVTLKWLCKSLDGAGV